MLQPRNKFKPVEKTPIAVPRVTEGLLGQGLERPTPQPILKPRPEDIPDLVRSSVPTAFWVECTPEIMRACLALNKENYRPLMVGWRDQIQSDMLADPLRFIQAGDPIRFDTDGLMFDGQHRFEAGAAARLTFEFLFVVGLSKKAREVIDFGRPRKIAHVVRNMGYDNAYLLSATATWLCRFRKGQSTKTGLIRGQSGAGTTEEILATIKQHPGIVDSAKKFKQSGKQAIPGSVLAALHYIGANMLNKKELANAFISGIINYHPKKSKQTSATYVLCYELEDRRQRGLHNQRDFAARKAVQAWNLFMQGIEVTEDYIEVPEKLSFTGLDYDVL